MYAVNANQCVSGQENAHVELPEYAVVRHVAVDPPEILVKTMNTPKIVEFLHCCLVLLVDCRNRMLYAT